MERFLKNDQANDELAKAGAARALGNEGRSRVHARRAAGWVIRAYFQARGLPFSPAESAHHLLQRLAVMDGLPEEAHRAAEHLTLRVDEHFNLPQGIDLIQQTMRLAEALDQLDNK